MSEQIDLLLINPGGKKEVYGDLGCELSAIEPPIWAALIAAFAREKGHSVRIIPGYTPTSVWLRKSPNAIRPW